MKLSYQFEDDNVTGPPWDEIEGHGPVVEAGRHSHRSGNKRPGWRPLHSPVIVRTQLYYDWKEACRMARVEGWDAPPYGEPGRIQRAVQHDFDYLRQYVAGDWGYVCVVIRDENCRIVNSVCGVETYKGFHEEFAEVFLAETQHIEDEKYLRIAEAIY